MQVINKTAVPTFSLILPHEATRTNTPATIFTQTPVATSIPPIEARLDFDCLNTMAEPPPNDVYTGTVVLGGDQNNPTYFLNLSTWETKLLTDDPKSRGTVYEIVSPDRIWLAYKNLQDNYLTIRNEDNDQFIFITYEKEWFGLETWLNNRQLLISLDGGDDLILNPFTGERQKLPNDFPDLAGPIGIGADWWGPVYSPDLSKVVYTAVGSKIVLWDVQARQDISVLLSGYGPFAKKPVWSPDGTEFAIANQPFEIRNEGPYQELSLVSQDGKQQVATNLSSYYLKFTEISDYSWSPDASRVAFWLMHASKNLNEFERRLAILNLTTLRVTEYCVYGDIHVLLQPPTWSPDGTQLIVKALVGNDSVANVPPSIYLLDLVEGSAYKVAGDVHLIGWIK